MLSGTRIAVGRKCVPGRGRVGGGEEREGTGLVYEVLRTVLARVVNIFLHLSFKSKRAGEQISPLRATDPDILTHSGDQHTGTKNVPRRSEAHIGTVTILG